MTKVKRQIVRTTAGFFFLLTIAVSAQEEVPTLAQIQRAYDALKFDEAEKLGQAALAQPEKYSPADLVQLHLVMGYVAFLREQMGTARQNFESALSLQPDLTLDSLLVSPKIVRLFEEVKNEYRVGLTAGSPSIRYVTVEDHRMAALRRSLLLPGWGQRHLQRSGRGLVYTLGFLAAAGAGIAFHVLQNQAHDDYLASTTPEQIEENYDTYNQLYHLRDAMLITAGSIWVINVCDILLTSPASTPQIGNENKAFMIGIRLPLQSPPNF
jgi:hypothetical protein